MGVVRDYLLSVVRDYGQRSQRLRTAQELTRELAVKVRTCEHDENKRCQKGIST
jgi:hypothetical protein